MAQITLVIEKVSRNVAMMAKFKARKVSKNRYK